jgi:bacillopeptidase F (M6 metalloprotease family)
VLDQTAGISAATPITFDTWYFIENGWDYGFLEVSSDNGATWKTVPITSDGKTITTDTNPQGNNTEGNGVTGVSGGSYDDGDLPTYISANATLPAGTTDARFRYSTDAGYLDTGWFVANVKIGGTTVTPSAPEGEWTLIDGAEQKNNWSVQIISDCDLTPGVTSDGEIVDGGTYVYRFLTDGDLSEAGFDMRCTKVGGKTRPVVVAISNLPTGQLTYFDSPYDFRLTNTGSGAKAR